MKLFPFVKHGFEILLALAYPLLIILTSGMGNPAYTSTAEGKLSKYYNSSANYLYPSEYPTYPRYPGEGISVYPGDEKWNGHYFVSYPNEDSFQVLDLDSDGTNIFAAVQGGQHQAARWNGEYWFSPAAEQMPTPLNGQVLAVAVQGSGAYYGGTFSELGSRTAAGIVYWDGANWHTLGEGLTSSDGSTSQVNRLLAVGDHGVIASGNFDRAGGVPVQNIAYWDGSAWHDLGGGLDGPVYALAGDLNNLYAGGAFTGAVAKWNGTAWTLLDGGIPAPGVVYAVAIKEGDVYAGGEFRFTPSGGTEVLNLARWDGSAWHALGTGVPGPVYSLASAPEGMYIGGTFDTVLSSMNSSGVLLWNGTNFAALGSGVRDPEANGGYIPAVYDLLMFSEGLYIGGKIDRAGYNRSSGFASWHTQPSLQPYDFPNVPVAQGSTIYFIGRYFPPRTALAVMVDGSWISQDVYSDSDGKAYFYLKTTRWMANGDHEVTLYTRKGLLLEASYKFTMYPWAQFVDTSFWGTQVMIGQEMFLPAVQQLYPSN